MNEVLPTTHFPACLMMRVEDNRVISIDIFGVEPEPGADRLAMERVTERVTTEARREFEAAGVSDLLDDVPTNLWLAPRDAEFMPGEG